MDSLGFPELAKRFLQIKDEQLYWTHDNLSLLEQLLFQLIAGYAADSSANLLKEDPIFQLILDKESVASQSSISRFWDRMMRTLCLPAKEKRLQIDTLRLHLFKIAWKLVQSSRQLLVKLSTTHVFQKSLSFPRNSYGQN